MEDEKMIKNSPDPVDISGTRKVLEQMMNCICKIKVNSVNGTGFFCKIPFENDSLKVFMTNYHVLDDLYYKNNKEINLLINDDKEVKIIKLGEKRQTYFNKKFDITIIELKENDNINNFLELDDNLFKEETKVYYKGISIYILHYLLGNKATVSYGLSTDIDNFEIKHICSTEHGSSGSPIINLSNHKVIGIHKQGSKNFNFNIGTCLKFPLKDFLTKKDQNDNSKIMAKLDIHDLLNDMINQNKAGTKIKISFNYRESNTFTDNLILEVNYGTTIDETLKYYLRRINRKEFINSKKIQFIYNENYLRFGDKSAIEIFFKSSPSPRIEVSLPFSLRIKIKKWFNWTIEEDFLIKDEFDKIRFESQSVKPTFGEKIITVIFNKEGSIIKITRSNYTLLAEIIVEYLVKTKNDCKIFKFNEYAISLENELEMAHDTLKNVYSKLFPKKELKDDSVIFKSLYKVGLEDNSEIIVN